MSKLLRSGGVEGHVLPSGGTIVRAPDFLVRDDAEVVLRTRHHVKSRGSSEAAGIKPGPFRKGFHIVVTAGERQ